ncbi:hypothetical protein AGMMS49938_11330 [Fibrobacterales bacterium]|nr:hypothetical protein AGMMS49938_11330 [Fibrobacterales bacterium]
MRFLLSNFIIFLLFLTGFAVRLLYLNEIPRGVFGDEAFAAWESWALLNYGIDVGGYSNAVVIPYYGVGAAPFFYHFATPFIVLFGPTVFAVRLAQSLLGCLTLVVTYLFAKKVLGKKFAMLALFLLVINPWHIMMSRQGVEIYPSVFFLLFGSYLFCLGLEKPRLLILSAFVYGVSLYCYPPMWIIIPCLLLPQILYCFYCRKIKISKEFLISGAILALMAVPPILFLLVQWNIIPEVSTKVISIPKMPSLRTSEFSLNVLNNCYYFFRILFGHGYSNVRPNDYIPDFMLFYAFGLPFIAIGIVCLLHKAWIKLKVRNYYAPILFLFPVLGAIPYIMFHSGDSWKAMVHQYIFVYIALILCGSYGLLILWKRAGSLVGKTITFLYFVSFIYFTFAYFNRPAVDPKIEISPLLQRSQASDAPIVWLSSSLGLMYGDFLLESLYPPDSFSHDAKWSTQKNSNFMRLDEVGRYRFMHFDKEVIFNDSAVYIFPTHTDFSSFAKELLKRGFDLDIINNFAYGYKHVPKK